MKRTLYLILMLASLLLALPLRAALPDPVAFGVAMEVGDTDRARRWLEEGLSPNFLADRIGTGLMIAAWEGNIPLMEVFVSHGADVNFANSRGEQALLMASWQGQTEAVKWLLAHGAEVSRRGKEWSALHYAVFAGNREIAKLLMERGADVNGKAPNGSTVLMMAAREGHEDLARDLLAAGADPRPRNEWGDSALTWAMRNNNLKIAKMVSNGDAFALAAKIPPQAYGQAIRSVPPPGEISELLRQIRKAEQEGRPTDELRKQFHDAVDNFKRNAVTQKPVRKVAEPKIPKGLVITAERNKAGQEKAELVYGAPPATARAGTKSGPDPVEILHQITDAAAQGKNTDALRKQFYEAVRNFRGP